MDPRTPGLLVASASDGKGRRTPASRRTPPRRVPLLVPPSPRCHTRPTRPAISNTMTIFSCLFACCLIVGIALKSGVLSVPAWRAAPQAAGEPTHAFGIEIAAMEAVGDEFKSGARASGLMLEAAAGEDAGPQTLVLYIFSNTDPQYYGNLLFFIKHGMPGCNACEYIIVINQDPGTVVRPPTRMTTAIAPPPATCPVSPGLTARSTAAGPQAGWALPTRDDDSKRVGAGCGAAGPPGQRSLPAPPEPVLRLGHVWVGPQDGGHRHSQVQALHLPQLLCAGPLPAAVPQGTPFPAARVRRCWLRCRWGGARAVTLGGQHPDYACM